MPIVLVCHLYMCPFAFEPLHDKTNKMSMRPADAQADLSLRWAHTHFVGFVMSRLILYNRKGTHPLVNMSDFVSHKIVTSYIDKHHFMLLGTLHASES